MDKVFKIRDKDTLLFSKGGGSGKHVWSKQGKAWTSIGYVKNHLHHYLNDGEFSHDYPYHNAEIIEVEMSYEDCYTIPVDEFTEEMRKTKKEMEASYSKRQLEWQEQQERKLLEELKKKYPESDTNQGGD